MYTAFMQRLREVCARLPDSRKGGNNQRYKLRDGCLSAFGVFFTQSPSFLAYQREMRLHKGQDNAQSLFGVAEIPSDNQIRNLLDPIDPACLGELFWWTLAQLQAGGQLADFHGYAGQWLCALDGVQYFSSDTIHCDQCTRHQHGKKTRYSHSVIAPVLVAPGHGYVVSLEPEFITPQDGADKQDSEAAAAQRWTARQRGRFAPWRVTILADDLHSHEPFCRALLQEQYSIPNGALTHHCRPQNPKRANLLTTTLGAVPFSPAPDISNTQKNETHPRTGLCKQELSDK
jgi:hypothetical protein